MAKRKTYRKATREYLIDVPNHTDPTLPWEEQASFFSKKEALAYVRKHYGADKDGNICLISVVDIDPKCR